LVHLHFDGALFAGFFEANLVDHDRGLVRFRLAPDDHAVVAFVKPVRGTIDVIQGRRAQPAMFPNVLWWMGEHENRDAILPTEPFERPDGAADIFGHGLVAAPRVFNLIPWINRQRADAIAQHGVARFFDD